MKTHGFERQVDRAIRHQRLFAPKEKIVVAVSGGPDSVALLSCLVTLQPRWDWELTIAHINHGLRGGESEGDMAYVEHLARSLGIPFKGVRLPHENLDRDFPKQSLQEVARTLRYQALHHIVHETNSTKLALGHTQDDQAETVLMWMLRGSGTGGMSGIPPRRGGIVVRPLLDFPRTEIHAYLAERHIEFRMDSSNVKPIYLRNRVRQELIPQLQSFSPGIVKVLSRQARMLREDHAYLDSMARENFAGMSQFPEPGVLELNKDSLKGLPISLARRVIRMAIQHLSGNVRGPRFDFVQRVLDRVTHGQSGWSLSFQDIHVTQEYERVVFRRDHSTPFEGEDSPSFQILPSPVAKEVVWPLTRERLRVWWEAEPMNRSGIPSRTQIYCDAKTFSPELCWRTWRAGDVFFPKGMGGRKKKLQDFFSDMKLPRSLRGTVPLLVAPEGILWVAGLRADERFQVSSETTSVMGARIYDSFSDMIKA